MSRKSKITYHPELSVAENARLNGVSIDGIYYFLKVNNIQLKQNTRKGLVEEISKAIKEYPDMGQRGLAKKTGHSLTTINKYYKAAIEALKQLGKKKQKSTPIDLKHQIDSLIKEEHGNTQRLSKHPKYYPIPSKEDLFKVAHERYDASKYLCTAFRRKGDLWKGLKIPFGNMNGGFSFEMNGVEFPTSEHAYISGLFSENTPKHIELQKSLLKVSSGYMAKRNIRTKYKDLWRKDWESFNIDWMLYCVWNKAKNNEQFRNMLMAVPRNAMIIEDVSFQRKPKAGRDTSTVWGCRNQDKKMFGGLVHKYADTHTFKTKQAKKDFINGYLWDFCNYGEYVGQNIMGKILTIIKNCLHKGTSPDIDYAMLDSKNVYLLGKRISFQSK